MPRRSGANGLREPTRRKRKRVGNIKERAKARRKAAKEKR